MSIFTKWKIWVSFFFDKLEIVEENFQINSLLIDLKYSVNTLKYPWRDFEKKTENLFSYLVVPFSRNKFFSLSVATCEFWESETWARCLLTSAFNLDQQERWKMKLFSVTNCISFIYPTHEIVIYSPSCFVTRCDYQMNKKFWNAKHCDWIWTFLPGCYIFRTSIFFTI